jgi:hypothetical protein
VKPVRNKPVGGLSHAGQSLEFFSAVSNHLKAWVLTIRTNKDTIRFLHVSLETLIKVFSSPTFNSYIIFFRVGLNGRTMEKQKGVHVHFKKWTSLQQGKQYPKVGLVMFWSLTRVTRNEVERDTYSTFRRICECIHHVFYFCPTPNHL